MFKKIKLFDPVVDAKEEQNVKKVLQSGFWASGSGSNNVELFEKKFKRFIGAKSCVAVNSGTAALHLALSLIDIKNKEVIIPSMSFVSTAHAVIYNQGIPIFADVDKKTLNLDSTNIEKKISKRTKAIIPVHFGGLPAEMNKIKKIALKNDLEIIEDAAHACGARFKDKMIGRHSPYVCFSFHPVKNLAMPGGGLIAINSKEALKEKEKLNALRWCGISNRNGVNYDVDRIGWNYYMNEFSAVIGQIQLSKLNKLNRIRQKIAKRYFEEINLEEKMPYSKNSVYHFYWIMTDNREKLRKRLARKGIETGIHYQPIHKMKIYEKNIVLKNTEYASKRIVTIPTHPNLSNEDITFIINSINQER